jgi:phosphoribosylaminoimidazolecarboxamide formyltransferase/IMP cyclohydrolase
MELYQPLMTILQAGNGVTSFRDRKWFAAHAFNISSHYDTRIFSYFNRDESVVAFRHSELKTTPMRYGENPHQKARFFGDLQAVFTQLNGKELSYNNLVDVDAAVQLIGEFTEPTVAIIKHTNPCGVASRKTLKEAYLDALACDPVSAFGGIIIANGLINSETAEELNKLFFEILIADGFEIDALERLKSKKNRIILQKNSFAFSNKQFKSVLNGILEQDKDLKIEQISEFQYVTKINPSPEESEALIFANKIVKHLKSNTIVLVSDRQLIGCGMGQTSRVDALRQAIIKARAFGFSTGGAVMASDAFFPFADCVEIAHEAGITSVIQPGGSIRDVDSVSYCDEHNMSMVFTGTRHFKH